MEHHRYEDVEPAQQSGRRKDQQHLEAFYNLLAENVRDFGVFLMDIEGQIIAWNVGAERIMGWREDEVIGQHSRLIFTPEDRAAGVPEAELAKTRTNGRADDIRWHLRKDGSRFFAEGSTTAVKDESGNLLGFGKVLRDVTERKEQEERLATSHRHIFLILESISDAFYAVDAEFRFTYVNRRAEEWWGRKREELIGRHYWSEFPHAVGSESYRYHLTAMNSRKSVHYETVSPLVKHWVDVNIYPADDGGLAVYFRDITQRKHNEQALKDAFERERAIAQALQRPLTLIPEPDTFSGLTLAMHYEPAFSEADAGGDFFDAFELPRGRVCLAVADASGKGLQAAARAIQVKEVLRAFTREYPHGPAHIAARINDYVHESQRLEPRIPVGELFVTLILVILDPHTGEASVVSAGAEPALILRASGKVEVIEAPEGMTGMPLGIRPGAMYYAVPLRIGHGDTILLTTDGLTEARKGRSHFLGIDSLAKMAQAALAHNATGEVPSHVSSSMQEAATAIVEGVFRDDVCLLLARRR